MPIRKKPTLKCYNPACSVIIHLSKAQEQMVKEGKHPCCCNACRYACRYAVSAQTRTELPKEVQCAHTGEMFEPSIWQAKRAKQGLPVFSNPGYGKAAHYKRTGNLEGIAKPKPVLGSCPWESGSMPTAWRVTPIW